MKKLQKFILPALIVAAIAIMYFGYFAPRDGLGSFSNFDPNSHASQEIIVKYLDEKGITLDRQAGSSVFYVVDGDGVEMLVNGPASLPPGMDAYPSIILVGHLSGRDSFHAHDVRLRN